MPRLSSVRSALLLCRSVLQGDGADFPSSAAGLLVLPGQTGKLGAPCVALAPVLGCHARLFSLAAPGARLLHRGRAFLEYLSPYRRVCPCTAGAEHTNPVLAQPPERLPDVLPRPQPAFTLALDDFAVPGRNHLAPQARTRAGFPDRMVAIDAAAGAGHPPAQLSSAGRPFSLSSISRSMRGLGLFAFRMAAAQDATNPPQLGLRMRVGFGNGLLRRPDVARHSALA